MAFTIYKLKCVVGEFGTHSFTQCAEMMKCKAKISIANCLIEKKPLHVTFFDEKKKTVGCKNKKKACCNFKK